MHTYASEVFHISCPVSRPSLKEFDSFIHIYVSICYRWSETGKYGYPQPDNRELREDGLVGNESCLSVLVRMTLTV